METKKHWPFSFSATSTPKRFELLGERGSDSRISKAPSDNTAISVMPPVPALGLNATPRVEVVHGV
jgi:hypothetical protein